MEHGLQANALLKVLGEIPFQLRTEFRKLISGDLTRLPQPDWRRPLSGDAFHSHKACEPVPFQLNLEALIYY